MNHKPAKRPTRKREGQNQPEGAKKTARQRKKTNRGSKRWERFKNITPANKLLIFIGAIGALSAAMYATAFVYQVWKQEQRADFESRHLLSIKVETNEVTDQEIIFTAEINNSGNESEKIMVKYCIFDDPNLFSWEDCGDHLTVKGPFLIFAHEKYPLMIRVGDDRIPDVLQGKKHLFLRGAVFYEDDGWKSMPICTVYLKAFRKMGGCSDLQNQ